MSEWPQGWHYSRQLVRTKYREDNLHVFRNKNIPFTKTFSGYKCSTEQATQQFLTWYNENHKDLQ